MTGALLIAFALGIIAGSTLCALVLLWQAFRQQDQLNRQAAAQLPGRRQ